MRVLLRWREPRGRVGPVNDLTLFEVPAGGELFDCRPFEVERVKVPQGADLTPGSWRCPACGGPLEVTRGALCARCETAGYTALTMGGSEE